MNYDKLLETIKSIGRERLNEYHHSARYGRTLSMNTNRYKPKGLDLAEEDKEEKEDEKPEKNGRTATGQVANKINLEPEYNSPMSLNRGMPKPQIDTK